jgi:uncharacterized protein
MASSSTSNWLTGRADGVRLAIKVTPRAGKAGVTGVEVDARGQHHLAVRLTEAPDGGKANAALIKFLARRWRLPPSALRLVSGASTRRKVLHVRGPAERLIERLEAIEGSGRVSAGTGE